MALVLSQSVKSVLTLIIIFDRISNSVVIVSLQMTPSMPLFAPIDDIPHKLFIQSLKKPFSLSSTHLSIASNKSFVINFCCNRLFPHSRRYLIRLSHKNRHIEHEVNDLSEELVFRESTEEMNMIESLDNVTMFIQSTNGVH